ncbi:acyl-CoA dehydrogenase family protein [Nocardioides hungaricus]
MHPTASPTREELRLEVRRWLAQHLPRSPLESFDTEAGFAAHREWERLLHSAGLAVVTWPVELGGRGLDIIDWLIFEEEYWASGAPGRVGQNGIFLLAPAIFEFGTEEQKARLLPPMARGDEVWAQAWSEPGAGSDLAALTSRADRTEGGWRLNGHKIWSTRAAFADRMFGLFRTDQDAERHRGLTYFLVPMSAEGVTVRPIRQLDGGAGFAEIFLDDVLVTDDDVLGDVDRGWHVAMSTTASERGLMLRSPGRFLASSARLLELWRRVSESEPVRAASLEARVVDARLDAEAYRLYVHAAARASMSGTPVGPESSANKLFWSELDIRIHETGLDLVDGWATRIDDADVAPWVDGFEFSLAGPIYAGTNEIQRNIIAERILGLPRDAS